MIDQLLLLRCLRNPVFACLYRAQTINLIGDALTWVGMALVVFEIAGLILSRALTLRVSAYVVLSPLADAIALQNGGKEISTAKLN